jgi:putative ABC transport system permease protein
MTLLRIALRNLNRQKKRSFLLGGAIAFGFLIITLVNAFAAGFVVNIRENVSQLIAGHLFITGYEKSASGRLIQVIRDDAELLAAIKRAELDTRLVAPRTLADATLIFAGEAVAQQIVGVEWEEQPFLRDRLVLRAGSIADVVGDPRGLILNESVAEQLGVEIGEVVVVQARTATGQRNVSDFVLRATTVNAGFLSTFNGYGHLDYINRLLNIGASEYVTLGILLQDLDAVDSEAERLFALLEDQLSMAPRFVGQSGFFDVRSELVQSEWEGTRYQLTTINDFLANVDGVAQALIIAGAVVALILFTIIMVGITNTFRMIVHERTREIGTMRALGLHSRQTRRLFLLEALFLSLGGAALGFIVALIGRAILQAINFGFDTPLFIMMDNGHLTFTLIATNVLGYVVGVAGLTLLAALFPANRAAAKNPADALRTTV